MTHFHSNRRSARAVLVVTSIGVLGLVATSLGAGATRTPRPSLPQISAPLNTAMDLTGAAWGVLPMGRLQDPKNTFWQTFFRATGSSRWTLVTPPGVAANGGFVLAPLPSGTMTVGIEPSQALEFTPLAQSTNGGVYWSPDLVPERVLAVPDAIAEAPKPNGALGVAVALVRGARGLGVESSDNLNTWTPLVSEAVMRTALTAACALDDPTALGLSTNRTILIGSSCLAPGRVGLFRASSHAVAQISLRLPSSLGGAASRVLRLVETPSGITGLVAAGSGRATSLVAIWEQTHGWTQSAPMPFNGASLVSTSIGPSGEWTVLSRKEGGLRAATVRAGAARWATLAPPPPGTSLIADTGSGAFNAFIASGAHLEIDALSSRTSHWVHQQAFNVPIQYGSSS